MPQKPPRQLTPKEIEKRKDALAVAMIMREQVRAEQYGKSLKAFLKAAWPVMQPGEPFVDGWHIDCMCDHLTALFNRQIRRLIINISRRSSKSSICSVAGPAWRWINAPHEKFLCSSYGEKLSLGFSRKTRDLIKSSWYQSRWSDKFSLTADQNEKGQFENDKGGYRIAGSVESGALGMGGSFRLYDDPNDLRKMQFPDYPQTVRDWYSSVAAFCNIDPKTDVSLLVQQRATYGNDLTDYLKGFGWEHVVIPNEYDGRRMVSSIGWQDPRITMGELMCPGRFGPEETALAKLEGRHNYQGSFQQSPIAEDDTAVKREWWRFYNPPGMRRVDEFGKTVPVRITIADGTTVEVSPVDLPAAFEHVVSSWDCLDSDTEVLALDGWKKSGGISVGDLIFSLNTSTQKLEIVPALASGQRTLRPGEAMTSIQSIRINVRVTENHDLYLGSINGRSRVASMAKIKAGEVASRFSRHRSYRLITAAEFDYPGVPLSDDELRLIAWFITDGGFGNQYIQISQSKEYKYEIRALIARLGMDCIERQTKPNAGSFANAKPAIRFLIPKGTRKHGHNVRSGWVHLSPWLDKEISPLLMSMTAAQFKVFWDELMKGDGDFKNGYLCTARKTACDRLQQMAVTRGYSSSSHSRPSPTGTTIWYVSVRNKRWLDSKPTRSKCARINTEIPSIQESVWCVENQNGTLITRRHGKICVMGNCAFKSAEHNDYVAGHQVGRLGANCYLLNREHGHWNFPDTLAAVRRLQAKGGSLEVLIEDAANGRAVIDTFKNEIPGVIAVNPEGGKWARTAAISGYIEAGNVYLPNPDLFPWVWDVIKEFSDGQQAKHDDDRDAMTQALKRLYDSMARTGVPEFRIEPRLGEPQTACHVQRERVPVAWRRMVAIVPGCAAVWIAETPTGGLRVIRELALGTMDAAVVGREIARLSLPDVLARASQIRELKKQSYELFLPKAAFAPIEPIGSYAELMEQALLEYESEEGDFDARGASKQAIREAHFRTDMIEEEDAALDRLRSLLAFQPPDFQKVPYDRKKAIRLSEIDIQQYADYMASVEGEVRGEWPKIKISPDCPQLIAQLGSFRRDKMDEAPPMVRALLLGVCAPQQSKPKELVEVKWPASQGQRGQSLMTRKFGRR